MQRHARGPSSFPTASGPGSPGPSADPPGSSTSPRASDSSSPAGPASSEPTSSAEDTRLSSPGSPSRADSSVSPDSASSPSTASAPPPPPPPPPRPYVAWLAACEAHGVLDTDLEPANHHDALRIPHRRTAMEQEYQALLHNQTWTLVPPPPRVNVIDSKWVFKVKRHSDGSIERYKARLVA
ncbi:hypothetical protein QYE76_014449 [Lolium multiflorum]|uniref:Reverse transcriptase Ty1/copia-type domain-containing protein n=1 Tax=Lolium multiflorum TaxID=4521 RepID=A0AAD8U4U2_LOLMU|nr:hypothetical protein QYE76_014449 [Lolium multiflorum]